MKSLYKILIAVAIIILIPIAYYLISPAFIVTELDEPLVNDRENEMSAEEKAQMERAISESQNNTSEMNESMDGQVTLLSQASFKASAHDVEGSAKLVKTTGGTILRFENFDTINGPNLHVYLASDLSDDDFVDLGELRATRGNFNYNLDQTIDLDHYNKVLVWCVPFGVLFSYADLS